MRFAKEMMEAKKKLEQMGHNAEVPCDTQKFIDDPAFTTDNHEENYRHVLETDIMRKCFNKIAGSDAIVVLNHTKNGVPGHIGANSLIEIGLAYYLNKKIFLLHHPPNVKEEKSTHEVLIMQPVILDGDLERINQ
jgi:hypothetical protein